MSQFESIGVGVGVGDGVGVGTGVEVGSWIGAEVGFSATGDAAEVSDVVSLPLPAEQPIRSMHSSVKTPTISILLLILHLMIYIAPI